MTPEWRVPLVPDCRISIILATFDPDLLAIDEKASSRRVLAGSATIGCGVTCRFDNHGPSRPHRGV